MHKILKDIEDKKILILGFGREGQSTLGFLRKYFPNKEIAIADQNKCQVSGKNIKTFFGRNYLAHLSDFDIIFKTPGISHKLPGIKKAVRKGIKITSQTQLFFDLCQGTIIGITGTKGKSTTATLIYEILKKANFKVIILGNIGKPCLDYLDNNLGRNKYFVFELSSHQLFDLKKSPHIAVFLNIYREHLDYYNNFREYFEAKANITRFQDRKDVFIFNSTQKRIANLSKKTKAKPLGFSDKEATKIFKRKEIPLLGKHNLNNIMASFLVAKSLGISSKVIKSTIKDFNSLEYRLERVGEVGGISFFCDSLATIPEATMAAMDSFRGKKLTLILGGADRGQNFHQLARKIKFSQNVVGVVLVGETGKRIEENLGSIHFKSKVINLRRASMDKIVKTAFKLTPGGGVILLSPAAASFDMFKDYKERGEEFKKAVRNL